MPNTSGEINITLERLQTSFRTDRRELATMPLFSMSEILPYVTLITGLRHKLSVSELVGDMQVGNYDKTRRDDTDFKIDSRELEVFFGSAIKGIDPNSIYQSIWGSNITKGDGLKNVPIVKAVATYLMGKLGEHLFENIWTAKHEAGGATTDKLFNGLKTIIDQEIAAGSMTVAKKSLFNLSSLTAANAEDQFKDFYWTSHVKLRRQNLNLICSPNAAHLYDESYQDNHGSLPYNQQYTKRTIEGSNGKCTIVPLANVPDNFLCLTTKENLLIGTNISSEWDTFNVEKSLSSHFLIDFVATLFFGTQIRSINPEMISVAEVSA